MASLVPEIAVEEALGVADIHGDPARRRRPRLRLWRGAVIFIAGLYFLLPLYAGVKFSLENDNNQLLLVRHQGDARPDRVHGRVPPFLAPGRGHNRAHDGAHGADGGLRAPQATQDAAG